MLSAKQEPHPHPRCRVRAWRAPRWRYSYWRVKPQRAPGGRLLLGRRHTRAITTTCPCTTTVLHPAGGALGMVVLPPRAIGDEEGLAASVGGRPQGPPGSRTLTVRQLAASTGRESGRQAVGSPAPAADAASPISGRRRAMPPTIASPMPSSPTLRSVWRPGTRRPSGRADERVRGMKMLLRLLSGVGLRVRRTGTGALGERGGAGRFATWAASPSIRWPPLRLARLRCERVSVCVVCPLRSLIHAVE